MISRVNDDNNELLQTLQTHHAMIDSIITVRALTADTITLQADGCETFEISTADADYIRGTRVG